MQVGQGPKYASLTNSVLLFPRTLSITWPKKYDFTDAMAFETHLIMNKYSCSGPLSFKKWKLQSKIFLTDPML